jgi:ribosome maturation factor RimP
LKALDSAFERRSSGRRFCFGWSLSSLRGRTPEDRDLVTLLDPVVEAAGYELVRLRLMGGTAARRLQIMAERPDGSMNVEDCAKLSRAVSVLLDETDPIAGEYTLEVSSPGIDRPLTRFKDFSAHEGLEARIELDRMAEGRKRFRGILAGTEIVDGQEMVAIDLEGEDHTALAPFDWIIEAKLVLNDQLLKLGADRRAADLSQSEFMTDADDGDGNIEE